MTESLEWVGQHLLDIIAPGWQDDPHMADTPQRWAAWWREVLDENPPSVTTFPTETTVDQMVAVTGIETWSLCAHHLLPFSVNVAIGYIADRNLLGLSKFARIAIAAARRPTTQEQLASTIADQVEKATGSGSVAVTVSGLHLCMAMRGVRTPATMTTSITRGAFRDEPSARAEWFSILARTAPSPHS
jgi:GTP cyclohydrolase I